MTNVGDPFWPPLLASFFAATFTTLGILVIRRFERWNRENSTYFASFAAGVLIAVAFLHIIPKSFSMNAAGPAFLLSGYLFLYLFNRFVTAHVCDRPDTEACAIGVIPLVGIGFHSFLDGVVYSIAFKASLFTGVLAATGMVLHEFPEGVITYVLLLRGGFSTRKAFALAFIAAALTTPVGTIVSQPLISDISQPFLGALLALSAGALIYVGATHLLPQAEKEKRPYSLIAVAGGVLVAVVMAVSGT